MARLLQEIAWFPAERRRRCDQRVHLWAGAIMSVSDQNLSRRERQIMEVIYAQGRATASEVVAGLPDPPTRTAVRTLLRILEEKGHLRHRAVGREFVYRPTRPR